MTAETPQRSSLIHNRGYAAWLVSDTAKGLASALFAFAIPLIALFVTNDPAQAGIISAVGMVARTLTTLYGGVLADRHARVPMMVRGSLVGVALAAAFTVLAMADALTFVTLFILELLLAVRSGLFDVAGEAALKEIVPADAMGRAQAANQGRNAVLELAGGPLGGAMLAIGAWAVGTVMALSHAIAAGAAWLLQRPHVHRAEAPKSPAKELFRLVKPSVLREVREGFGWLLARPDLRGVLFVTTIINLGFSAALTTVIYALQQAGHSALTIGLLGTGSGAAMLAGAILAPWLVARVRAGVILIAGLAVAVVGIVALILVHEPLPLILVLAAVVLFIPAINAALGGYSMVATPTELLGRVNSASMVLGMGAVPLAPLIAGFGLSVIGREKTLLVASVLCVCAVLLASSNRGLRAIPAESGWSAHAAQFTVR